MIKTQIIGEIGINFAYGEDKTKFLENTKKLIDVACVAGCDYVKFQKRTPILCVPNEQKGKAKRVPWNENEITYLDYKNDSEFGKAEFDEIDKYCDEKGMKWFASVWDTKSVDFMSKYEILLPNNTWGSMMKIPSALINDVALVEYAREYCEFLIISTGMSTQKEIDTAIYVGSPDVVMHTNSTYPSPNDELNLDYIRYLTMMNDSGDFDKKFDVGYSGHEFGLTTSIVATVLGATWIERHITLDRTLWGSDQMASVEPQGLIKLVKSIRDIENARGGYGPRKVLDSEKSKRKSLRGE